MTITLASSALSHFSVTKEHLSRFKISTRMLFEVALKKGYTITYYPSSPASGSGIAKCEKDAKVFYFKSTCTLLTSSLGVYAAENKSLTYALLNAHGINTPDYLAMRSDIDTPDEVYAMLEKHPELVVKPVQTNHGDGITLGITHKNRLEEAVSYARGYCKNEDDIIVQQQVYGKEYRFLVVEGKTVAVSYRMPPYVIGDGVATVRELIEQKNLDPRRGNAHSSILTKISLDDVRHYAGDELLEKVLDSGERVDVLATSNLSRGGEAVDYTDIASKQLKDMAAKAAETCFLGVAGVDIMTNDITAPSVEGSYVIEVNLTPGLRMHQFPSEGKPRDVASMVFKAIERTARPSGKKLSHVGKAEKLKLVDIQAEPVHARIDSGATISSIWASDIHETEQGLSFKLFDKPSPHHTGQALIVKDYSTYVVSSSMGQLQSRYKVRLRINLKGRTIRASFTLADRSTQAYPILVGRNILRNKFIVDVSRGSSDKKAEDMLRKKKESIRRTK